MKSKCILLLKSQLSNEFARKSKSKGRTVTTAAIGLVAVMMIIYAFFISYGLGSIGMATLIPSYGVALTSLIMLFFTAFKANGVLFAYREYDFIMSLPVKTSTVIASRFLTMYLMNLGLTAAVMIAMGAGYVIFTVPGPFFYIQWIFGILAVPLIPTTLASLLGVLIILFSSRFKYANAVVTIVSLALIIGVLVLSFGVSSIDHSGFDLTTLKSLSEILLRDIHKIYPPAVLFYRGIVHSQPLSMLIFLAASVLWYYIFIKAVSVVYKKLNTSLTTFHARTNYKLSEIKASSQLAALYRKESKRFFSSSIYCLNMGMGVILTVIASIACLFISQDTLAMIFKSDLAWEMIQRVLPFAIGALLSMTCTTCISLSLEGKNLWILKSLPIQDATIFKCKILWNLTLQIPAALIAALLINIRFPLNPVMRLLTFVTPIACAFFNTLWGMFINLQMPQYDWVSLTALVKQSIPSMAGLIGGLIGGLIPVGVLILLKNINAEIVTAALTAVLALGAFLLWQYIKVQKIQVK